VRNRVIIEKILFEGTLTESLVSPRETIKEALNESAAGLIFAHNNPSRDPSLSKDHHDLTKRLQRICDMVGIRVLDHIIVRGERFFSLAVEGLL